MRKMKILQLQPVTGAFYPAGMQRLDYASAMDGEHDWALLRPGKRHKLWIVVLHGHGANATRPMNAAPKAFTAWWTAKWLTRTIFTTRSS